MDDIQTFLPEPKQMSTVLQLQNKGISERLGIHFNQSFFQIFPLILRFSKIIPTHKEDSKIE